jgi:hypothetical protein
MLQIIDNNFIKCNKMWGPEYILMDSRKFMGGAYGCEYDNIIDMLINIRQINRQPRSLIPSFNYEKTGI